jgi:hypothetical protein
MFMRQQDLAYFVEHFLAYYVIQLFLFFGCYWHLYKKRPSQLTFDEVNILTTQIVNCQILLKNFEKTDLQLFQIT